MKRIALIAAAAMCSGCGLDRIAEVVAARGEVHDPEVEIIVHLWDVGLTVKLGNVDAEGETHEAKAPGAQVSE